MTDKDKIRNAEQEQTSTVANETTGTGTAQEVPGTTGVESTTNEDLEDEEDQ